VAVLQELAQHVTAAARAAPAYDSWSFFLDTVCNAIGDDWEEWWVEVRLARMRRSGASDAPDGGHRPAPRNVDRQRGRQAGLGTRMA
jgi:hypothetical protein